MYETGHVLEDRYVVERILGHGGMAHVYAARDRHLERDVAIKVLRPHLTELDAERFRREIRALARLSHPGIVSIFDLAQGEFVYFVMERITGGPITDLGPYSGDVAEPDALLRTFESVASTLGHVHRLGMVHRDLTPQNILMTEHGQPKLTDFGLVQLTQSTEELTKTGFTLGTPQYMAPEQARGDHTAAFTDLYSLGVVLYRTLTGDTPFDGDNDTALLYQHVHDEPEDVRERNPSIPDALANVTHALLAKDPQHRPESAFHVASALAAIRQDLARAAVGRPHAGAAAASFYPSGPVTFRPLRERWRTVLDTGPQWPSSLVATGNTVMVGLRSDRLVELDVRDGSVRGTHAMPDEVAHAPIVVDSDVCVATRDGSIRRMRWPSGEVLWKRDHVELAGVSALNNDLFVTLDDGLLQRWASDGSTVWSKQASAAYASAPILFGEDVFAIDEEGGLACVHTSGSERFRVELGVAPAPMTVSQGVLILQERSGEMHGFDLQKREPVWSYGLDGEIWSAPAVWNGFVFAASWAQRLECISLRTGDTVWVRDLPGAVTASPVVASEVVWVVTETGELCAFGARDGTLVDQRPISTAPIQAPALPLNSAVVVAATDGTVAAYE